MSLLYVDENGAVINKEENRIIVSYPDGLKHSFPIETIESITIMGAVQLTTQCMETCLTKGIPVAFFSKGGKYFGQLHSTGHINAGRQRKQSELYGEPFAINFARSIIYAKIKNQQIVFKRYIRTEDAVTNDCYLQMANCRKKLESCRDLKSLLGYEGQSAKAYFKGLSHVIDPEFTFTGRSRRPPRDEFNSLISLGYTILMNQICAAIEAKGLNPFFGFMHQDHENHPTLASDLLEEWRAVLVDSTVMSLINGHEIHKEDFDLDLETGGYYLKKNGLKIFLGKLNNKLQTKVKYLLGIQ